MAKWSKSWWNRSKINLWPLQCQNRLWDEGAWDREDETDIGYDIQFPKLPKKTISGKNRRKRVNLHEEQPISGLFKLDIGEELTFSRGRMNNWTSREMISVMWGGTGHPDSVDLVLCMLYAAHTVLEGQMNISKGLLYSSMFSLEREYVQQGLELITSYLLVRQVGENLMFTRTEYHSLSTSIDVMKKVKKCQKSSKTRYSLSKVFNNEVTDSSQPRIEC